MISPSFNAKLDSGASKHFFKTSHLQFLRNVQPLEDGPIAFLPNNTTVKATHKGTFNLHDSISDRASEVLVFPHLTNESLISIGQLCDDNCIVIFTKTKFYVTKNGKFLFQGLRNTKDNLWDLNSHPTQHTKNESMNYIVTKNKTKLELARYYHAALFSPSFSTLSKAIRNGNLISWPGIDNLNFADLLGTSLATELGHLDQERKNLRSTKNVGTGPTLLPTTKTNEVYVHCFQPPFHQTPQHLERKLYSDQTGKFPYRSSRGNQYLLVMYDYDSNAIVFEALKTRQGAELAKAFQRCCLKLKVQPTERNLFILDNECSTDIKNTIRSYNASFQLVPPHQHRQNAAETAIKTVKGHLLSGIATCHTQFPITEWDRLLPQAELTLNLLRNSRINPKLSSWAFLNGQHDFNRHPLAPPGSKILVHSKPSNRASWAFHGVQGWYIGPALHHYRCVKCFIPTTRSEVVSDTVKFIPQHVPIPSANIDDYIRAALQHIISLLHTKNNSKLNTDIFNSKEPNAALLQVAEATKQHTPAFTPSQQPSHTSPSVPQNLKISEGGCNQKKPLRPTKHRNKVPPLTDEEFEKLLQNLRQPRTPTEGAKRPHQVNACIVPSIRDRYMYARVPLPKLRNPPMPTTTDVTLFDHLTINHMFNEAGKKQSIDTLLRTNPSIWSVALSNELGRLSQGIRDVAGNDVMDFIPYSEVPQDRIVTYANMVCDIRPLKSEMFRVRLTVGGDRLQYPDDTASPAATLLESKLLLNSTISQSAKGARFMTLDIKDFFLQTQMARPEFMKIHSKYFLTDITNKYNINSIVHTDGYVYCRIKRGMYGLKQAARLAYDSLKEHLAKHGYHPDKIATNIWYHTERKTKFCLCVDDFGVQYFSKDDANHLIASLQEKYIVTTDFSGTNFCGLDIIWDYTNGWVDISMNKFVTKTLRKLLHSPSPRKQHAPHQWQLPVYGQNRQFAPTPDSSPVLDAKGIKHVQRVVGSFLYYARAIDNTIITALNEIASMQAHPTQKTNDKIKMLLDYLHTHPNARIRFYASDMILYVDSDAAYLVADKAKSRIAGYYYCSNRHSNKKSPNPPLNGPIHIECKLLRHVVTSAAEAETAGLFVNCQKILEIKHMLHALGHPQVAIPVKTDNATAASFVTDMLKQKRSKAWDVRYHWLSEQQALRTFFIYWQQGCKNLADYHTKHHPPSYHQKVREKYVLKGFHTALRNLTNQFKTHARVC